MSHREQRTSPGAVVASSDYLIAVVDDDRDVRQWLLRALTAHGYRVLTFSSAREYLDQCQAINPTCVLADIRMPGLDGIAMHRAARDNGHNVPTVFMTAIRDISTVVEAMKAGASDLLAKPFSIEQLLSAIRNAVEQSRHATNADRGLAERWRSLAQLTAREAQVAALVASGRPNKQVAAALGVTEKTVKVHRARAMRKLRANSLAELVRIVDYLLAERHRETVFVDGANIVRPPGVYIIVRALVAARGTKA